ncbi:MAG: Hsp20/alpha crystallin family protein [Thermoguttaceae bacterium]
MTQMIDTHSNMSIQAPLYFRVPHVNIIDRENEYLIEAEIPGAKDENVHLQFHKNELTVNAKVETHESEKSKKQCRVKQFEALDFYRIFRVGESIDQNGISASLDKGVLTIHLPKKESVKPKKIAIVSK